MNAASPQVVPLPRLSSAVRYRSRGDVRAHEHPETELVYVRQGKLVIKVENVHLEGKPGTVFVLPARQPHEVISRGKWDTICILFSNYGKMIDESSRIVDVSRQTRIWTWFQELSYIHSAKGMPETVGDCLLLTLVSHINCLEADEHRIEVLHPRLAAAVSYLQQHAGEDVDTRSLARAVGVSYSRLGVLFRDQFGCAPLKYHQALRMELARKLLLNPYASIEEIAAAAGFSNVNYFCRLFHKTHGIPPGKWRKTTLSPAAASEA
jgi:AraC-like DNA-binding protein